MSTEISRPLGSTGSDSLSAMGQSTAAPVGVASGKGTAAFLAARRSCAVLCVPPAFKRKRRRSERFTEPNEKDVGSIDRCQCHHLQGFDPFVCDLVFPSPSRSLSLKCSILCQMYCSPLLFLSRLVVLLRVQALSCIVSVQVLSCIVSVQVLSCIVFVQALSCIVSVQVLSCIVSVQALSCIVSVQALSCIVSVQVLYCFCSGLVLYSFCSGLVLYCFCSGLVLYSFCSGLVLYSFCSGLVLYCFCSGLVFYCFCSGRHFSLVFRRSLLQISARRPTVETVFFVVFLISFEQCQDNAWTRSQPLPCKSFPVHFSWIVHSLQSINTPQTEPSTVLKNRARTVAVSTVKMTKAAINFVVNK
jgi:hypothetical protein